MIPTRLELWQTKWCPASHRVRQRLTELGLPYTNRQVPVDPYRRTQLEIATGLRMSPTLVADDQILAGEDAILAYLEANHAEPADALAEREQEGEAQQTGVIVSEVGNSYTVSTDTDLDFEDAVGRVREELVAEGFGVQCEIDVQATLKQKLGQMLSIVGNDGLASTATEVRRRLSAVVERAAVQLRADQV